jgi:hypothetical protein
VLAFALVVTFSPILSKWSAIVFLLHLVLRLKIIRQLPPPPPPLLAAKLLLLLLPPPPPPLPSSSAPCTRLSKRCNAIKLRQRTVQPQALYVLTTPLPPVATSPPSAQKARVPQHHDVSSNSALCNAAAAMPAMGPVKVEAGVGDAQEEEEEAAAAEDQAQQQQHPSRRRKVDAGGLAALQTRWHIEAQAAAFQGMDQTRVMGLELQQAKVQNAELKAEIKSRDASLQAKDAIIQGKDATLLAKDDALQASAAALQSKDAVIEANRALLHAKDVVIVAKDAEIQRLETELARRGAEAAAQPAPARAAAACAVAPAPAPDALSSQQLQVMIPKHVVSRHFPSPPPSPSGASVCRRGAAFARCRRLCGCSEAADGRHLPRACAVTRRAG